MHQHPYFDLLLHDTDELAHLIGSPVVARITIHEWPLSCVQRVHCASGQRFIYKTQAPPTVEPAFYAAARSPLLVRAQQLPCAGGPAALLFADLPAPRLCDLALEPRAVLATVGSILAQIAQIEGDLPAMIDIRCEAHWLDYAQTVEVDVAALVDSGAFRQVNQATIEQLRHISRTRAVRSAITGATGYVHHDLRAENILVTPDGYRVLDWQRPLWGPVALDRVTLLKSLGLDATAYVSPGVLALSTLLSVSWFAQAARYWFPAGAATYDAQIAELVQQLPRFSE